jgi:hypothetical protein
MKPWVDTSPPSRPRLEKHVKEDVRQVLKAHGIWYFQPVSNGMGVQGIPDFICCWRGRFLGIETKAPGQRDRTTANQKRILALIDTAGGLALVIDDVAQLEALLAAT